MILALVMAIFFSIFSTATMMYIAMATPIGPWIAPTIALSIIVLARMICVRISASNIALVTAAGSIGGILATAIGFSFPTLYFLDAQLFSAWLARPLFFSCTLSLLSLAAGLFGFWIADLFEESLIDEKKLPFPIGQLVARLILAEDQLKQGVYLLVGFFSVTIFSVLQDGIGLIKGIIPKSITVLNSYSWGYFLVPTLSFELWPMLWAIGFITGHVIALPLGVGALGRYVLAEPINRMFFPALSSSSFLFAFCSGLVVVNALLSMTKVPKQLYSLFRSSSGYAAPSSTVVRCMQMLSNHKRRLVVALFLMFFLGLTLTYFNFSPLVQLYLISFTAICTYQIIIIAGKIGLAQLGRFATFVMIPALLLFAVDGVQAVCIATFVEIAGGVATDILFGRKMGRMVHNDRTLMRIFQLLGLVISALTAGIIFWLLVNHFQLGSAELFAQRAQARQLLMQVQQFNGIILLIGALFGLLLKYVKINPMLVLGGLLMPLNLSVGLIMGGALAWFVRNKEQYYPFWSGVFAAQSVWMLVSALIQTFR